MRTHILTDELCLNRRREIHTLPSTVIAHRFVHRRECPNIYTLSLPCLNVFSQIACIGIIVFRQQRTAAMESVLALVVFLILFHPRRRRPSVRHDAVFLIRLILLDRPDVLHQMIEIIVFVLNLRILRFGKSLFVAIQRKRTQLHIAVLFRQRIFAFDGKIRCTDLRAAHGEVGSIFTI